jgi:hypothetical protein
MTEIELYDGVIMEGTSDLFFVADTLRRHNAGWCLIGGMAINAYVTPLYTADCDLVVVAAALAAVLTDLAAADWRIKEFPFSVNAQRRLKRDEKSTHKLMVQFTRPERYQPFADRAVLRPVFGRDLPVASIPDLVQGKLWALADPSRRESKSLKDTLDVLRLAEEYPELVEPLLPKDLRARSQTNRALRAQSMEAEGMGDYLPPIEQPDLPEQN